MIPLPRTQSHKVTAVIKHTLSDSPPHAPPWVAPDPPGPRAGPMVEIPYRPGGWVLHQPPWSFGFDSQTKTGAPCDKVREQLCNRSCSNKTHTGSHGSHPFSNGIFRSDGAPASLPPASSSFTHTRRMDGFCNQNADQLGSLAGLSFPAVYVGAVECAPASPYTYSSSTHRFPDECTPIEATPLSATSVELVLGVGLGLGLGSHSSSHSPLLLATLLSHNIPLPRVH
jgi:hypothetical protein